MKAIILALIIAMTMTGCGENTSRNSNGDSPAQPVQPIPEPEEPEVTIPGAGVGTIKGNLDCDGGTIKTNYFFGNVSEDNKNFVMRYQKNGIDYDLTNPSVRTNGSNTNVTDNYYVEPNEDERSVNWIVSILYQIDGETYNLVSTVIRQPACEVEEDDNLTSLTTIYEVK